MDAEVDTFLFLAACSAPQPEEVIPDTVTTPSELPAVDPSQPTRLARLSHAQWEATVTDLLHLSEPTGFEEGLLPDPAASLYDNEAAWLEVSPTLWMQYQAAAEGLARRVVTDDATLEAILDGHDNPSTWVEAFALRAYRRPPTPEEKQILLVLFVQGTTVFGSGDVMADGVRMVVATVLQAPSFLYRSVGVAGTTPTLESYELAAKLSYGLWNSMPDDELFDAAAAGLTAETLAVQVDRMLADPRAREMVAHLHWQLLDIDSYKHIYRSDTKMQYEESLPYAMEREIEAFVQRIVFDEGTVRDLLLSRQTQAIADIADIYGIPGVDPKGIYDLQLDPTERSGLLTLSGFLSMEADAHHPNLIGRGAFVHERLLCDELPPPPATAAPLPKDTQGRTLRERITDHTTACGGGCHEPALNALGFAFTGYDEAGRVQARDAGQPIDASSAYTFDDGTFEFDGVVELSAVLAERPQVHRCYAEHLLQWVEGRPADARDEARLDELEVASLGGRPILGLLRDLVVHEDFLLDP